MKLNEILTETVESKPKYRDDIKGDVAAIKKEYVDSLVGEFNNEESFFFGTKEEMLDSESYKKYKEYLTTKELLMGFKAAMKQLSRGERMDESTNWSYLTYENGKLYDEDGDLFTEKTFDSEEAATKWLEEEDIRATII